MIEPEVRARIRRLYYAEHWKVGTIAVAFRRQAPARPGQGAWKPRVPSW
jgi:hypothetical protein